MRSISCLITLRLLRMSSVCAAMLIGASMLSSIQARAETDGEGVSDGDANSVRQLTLELTKTRKALEEILANQNALSASLSEVVDLLKSIETTTGKIAGTQERMASDQTKKANIVVLSGVSHQAKSDVNLCSIILKNEIWKTLGVVDFTPATDQYLDPSTGVLTQKKAGFVAQLICSN